MQVADAFVRYLADTKDLAKAVGPGGPIDQGAQKGATTVGARFTSAFQKTSTAAGAVGGALFVGAVGGATRFEDQLRTINTVAGLTDDELHGVGDSILGLSKETGKSTDDLTAGFYDLVSAGIPAKDAINVLRDSAIFATGALGTTGEAVDVVTSALNAYGLSADQSGKVTDIFAKAVADGKVTASELGASIANIAPIAAASGISLEEVSAGFAVLTAKGVPAAQAATQMRAAISALLTPNEQLNKLQEKTGINFAELAKEKGLAVALEAIRVATDGNADAFAKSLGSIEAYQFALSSTGDESAGFATELGKVQVASDEGGTAMGQYEEQMKSAASRGKKLTAGIAALGIQIGGPFVESVGPAVSALGGMGQGLSGIFNISRLVGGGIGALVGKLAGILIPGILGVAAPAGVAGQAVGAATATGIGIGAVALPAILIAAVVAAIIFLVNNPEIVDQIAAFVGSFIENLMRFLGELPDIIVAFFGTMFAVVAARLPALVESLAGVILSLPGRIIGLYAKIIGVFVSVFQAVIARVPAFVGAVVGFILSIPGRILAIAPKIAAFFSSLGNRVIAIATSFIGTVVGLYLSMPGRIVGIVLTIVGFFGDLGRRLVSGVQTLVGNIVGFFLALPGRIASVGGRIVSGIIGGMASLPGKLLDTIARAFRSIKIDIGPFHISSSGVSIDLPKIDFPSFDVGSSFIPADMLAAVHKGEIIIPAREAEAIRRGRATLGRPGAGAGAGAGNTYVTQTTVHVDGFLRGRDKFELAEELRRVQDFRTPLPASAFRRDTVPE